MQFHQTKTFTNLARSFAGESQAGMRYQLIAKLATAEEYPVLADIVRTIAKNETYHAKSFFDMLIQKAGSCDNIPLDAGYPFRFGTLTENFAFAAEDERAEFEEVYPSFAKQAREEGFEDAAALFERVASVERSTRSYSVSCTSRSRTARCISGISPLCGSAANAVTVRRRARRGRCARFARRSRDSSRSLYPSINNYKEKRK